jgi:hypothetical protein
MSLSIKLPKKDKTGPYQKPEFKRYWPAPPIDSTYQYQNINKDINLRKNVTNFFHKKVLKWIEKYHEFAHLKSQESYLKSDKGKQQIYTLLRHFIKKSGINWYDLRDNNNIIKEYLNKKL